jgi:hypothetical protein
MLSVGFVMAMNILFEFEFVKRDWIHDLFYIKLSHDLFLLFTQFTIITSVDFMMVVITIN